MQLTFCTTLDTFTIVGGTLLKATAGIPGHARPSIRRGEPPSDYLNIYPSDAFQVPLPFDVKVPDYGYSNKLLVNWNGFLKNFSLAFRVLLLFLHKDCSAEGYVLFLKFLPQPA